MQIPSPPNVEGTLHLLCPMSKSLSGKKEGLQDNATRKKGSLLLTRVRAPATSNAVVWGQRAQAVTQIYRVSTRRW